MKKLSFIALSLLAFAAGALAQAPAAGQYLIRKIQPNIVTTPDVSFSLGVIHQKPPTPGQWVEIEVTFTAVPEYTEELTFRYYVLLSNGQCLTGEVTHVDVPSTKLNGNRDLMSVMYVSPRALLR